MGFIQWWAGLPTLWRYGVPLVLLLISTLIYFLGDRIWPWGWVLGGILLCAATCMGEDKGW